jgi:hypothetical protein
MMVVDMIPPMAMAAVAAALVVLVQVLAHTGTVVMDHQLLLLDLPKLMLAVAVEEEVLTPALLVKVKQVVVMVVLTPTKAAMHQLAVPQVMDPVVVEQEEEVMTQLLQEKVGMLMMVSLLLQFQVLLDMCFDLLK